MTEKPIKIPGPDHPITIAPNLNRVRVSIGGNVVADTVGALTLREAKYPAAFYIPRADVDMARLNRSTHTTYCPFKGDCSYYDLPEIGERGENAVWTYEAPFAAVEAIRGYLAFYPDRVDISEVRGS